MDAAASRVAHSRYLAALERLLAIDATAVKAGLGEASDVVAIALNAEKVDSFVYEESTHTLVALGTSSTPMARLEQALGLDRLPLANGGRAVQVYQTGTVFHHGHLEDDAEELIGIRESLGVRSTVCVPLAVSGVRRGVLQIDSAKPDAFTDADREFLIAVANWVGVVFHRSELVEQLTAEAQKTAQRITAEEIVTVLAHDLRNHLSPLMNRILLLRRLAEKDGHPSYAEEAAELGRRVERLSDLLTDLLDLARLERGLFSLDCRPVDLAVLAREATETMASPRMTFRVGPAEKIIASVDPKRIRQALDNLLSNATRHAAGSVVSVAVTCESRSGADTAVISVEDNGPGIPQDVISRVTDPFVRGNSGRGLGIGLYLVRGIAEAHRGVLEVESVVGRGSAFRLVLPIASASQPTG